MGLFSIPKVEILKEDDYEVIVVDDCSTDNTVAIVEEYAQSHNNLILLRQKKNHRQGAARNRGMKIARGEYVAFVDSDDETNVGIIESLSIARNLKLDVVAMHHQYINDSGEIQEKEVLNCIPIFSGIEFVLKTSGWSWGPCCYLFCRKFLLEVNYPFAEDVLFEDADFIGVHLYYAKHMGYSSACSYIIHSTLGSTTRTFTLSHATDRILLGIRNQNISKICCKLDPDYGKIMLLAASININIGCHLLLKMKKLNDVVSFYKIIDKKIERTDIIDDKKLVDELTSWSKLCVNHRYIATSFAILLVFFRYIAKIKTVLKNTIIYSN